MKVKYGTPLCKLKIQLRIPNSSSAVASLAAKIQLYYPCLLQNRLDWYCTSQDQCTVLRPFRRISQQPSSLHSPIWTNMDPYVPMQCNVDQYGPMQCNVDQYGPIWSVDHKFWLPHNCSSASEKILLNATHQEHCRSRCVTLNAMALSCIHYCIHCYISSWGLSTHKCTRV